MDSGGRILYLCDPLRKDGKELAARIKREYSFVTALIFDENERWLSQAQEVFAKNGFSAIAAEGNACAIALAMAAQLQVDRLMLRNCRLFDRRAAKSVPACLKRIISFARRNLPLAAARMQFADTDEAEIRRISNLSSRYAQIEVCAEKHGAGGPLDVFFRC